MNEYIYEMIMELDDSDDIWEWYLKKHKQKFKVEKEEDEDDE